MRISFGDVVLDSGTRQMWRAGQPVHISNKAFDLLTLLVSRRPDAVTKADIHRHLWQDTFVSETNLPTLIAEIREAIGDDARQMRYIRTIHRFGYAFQSLESGAPVVNQAPAAAAWLVGAASRVALVEGENLLGRESDDVVPLESPTISRRHARIVVRGDRATVEDLGSKNGTYVNGVRVSAATAVGDGDVVRVGDLVYTFRPVRPGTSTQTL